eukprot:438437-Ditylum_brightwellii.AAC.1
MDMIHAQNSMTLQQFPVEEDYWKTGKIGAIVYPNFGMWMPKRSEKAADTMWKIRDAFVAVKNTMHRFMPRCCGKAS